VRWLLGALLCHLLLAGAYARTTPAFEGPDENDHLWYAHQLAHDGRLPIVLGSAAAGEESPWLQAALGHHPPLYYWVLAGLLRALGAADTAPAWTDQGLRPVGVLHWRHGHDEVPPRSPELLVLFVLRGLSVLLGAVSLCLVYALGRIAFPGWPAAAQAGTLALACIPQWSYVHGILDNGNLAITLSLGSLLLLARALADGRLGSGHGVWLGITLGAALITKLTSLFLLGLLPLWWWLLPRPGRRAALRGLGLALLVAIAVAGWWFLRNWQLYGSPLGSGAHVLAFASNRTPAGRLAEYLVYRFVPDIVQSSIGQFGWWTLALPGAILAGFVLAVLAVVGWCKQRDALLERPRQVLLLAATAVLVFAGVVQFNLKFAQPQGRYLFPAAGPILLLAAAGWSGLGPRVARSISVAVLPGAVAALVFCFVPAFGVKPDAGPFHASLVAGLATPPGSERATIEATSPADGAEITAAPTFRWRDPTATPDSRYTVHAYLASGRILFGTFERGLPPLFGDHWELPAVYWGMLPGGVEIHWKVRRLPDRSRHESVHDVPESAPRRLVKTSPR
jgi:4-amino-4-deoxy-L-arabinose transferase-like glycosyltransferase